MDVELRIDVDKVQEEVGGGDSSDIPHSGAEGGHEEEDHEG